MIDLILRNARVAGQDELADLGVERGEVVAVDAGTTAAEVIDLAGRLVTPPLVEPHIHLDAVLTVGQPRPNVSGSLFEGIAVWAERVADLTYEDVQARVRQVLRWQLACGVQHVRSHVDVCDPQLTGPARARRPARGGARPDRPAAGRVPAAGHPRLRRRPGADAQGRGAGRGRGRRDPALRADPRGRRGVGQVRDGARRRARPARGHPLRRDRRRSLALRRGDGGRDDPAGHVRPGHGQPHDGHALVQQRVRLPADQQHCPGGPAHGDQPAGQLRAAGTLRHRPDPARPHPREAAHGGRRQRLHRA